MTKFRVERRNCLGHISDHRQLTLTNAIKLRGINFKVNDARVRSKARRLARDAVIQTRSENQQQIGFVQGGIRSAGAVHADHSQIIRSLRRNGAQSMNGGKRRNIQRVQQLPQVCDSTGNLRASSNQGHGTLRFF